MNKLLETYYLKTSGRSEADIRKHPDGVIWLDAMEKQLNQLDQLIENIGWSRKYESEMYNSIEYIHPKRVLIVTRDEEARITGLRNVLYKEWLSEFANVYKPLSETAIPRYIWDRKFLSDKLLWINGAVIVDYGKKISAQMHKMVRQYLTVMGFFNTNDAHIVIDKDIFHHIFNAVMFPEMEGTLEKQLGGRYSCLTSDFFTGIEEGQFDGFDWKIDPLGRETCRCSKKLKINGVECDTWKWVSPHGKMVCVYDKSLPPNTIIVGLDAIKGKYWQYGLHTTEAHLGYGIYTNFRKNRVKVSDNDWNLLWMLILEEHDTPNGAWSKVKPLINLYRDIIVGKASYNEILSVLSNSEKENINVEARNTAVAMIETAKLLGRAGWAREAVTYKTLVWTVLNKIRNLTIHVKGGQGKIYTMSQEWMKDGVVYLDPDVIEVYKRRGTINEGKAVLLRHPSEIPMIVDVLPNELPWGNKGCHIYLMTPNTAAAVGGDGDGDLAGLASIWDILHALSYTNILKIRAEAKECFNTYVSTYGKDRLEAEGSKVFGYKEKDGGWVSNLKSINNWTLATFISNSGSVGIGAADKAIQNIIFQMLAKAPEFVDQYTNDAQEVVQTLFQFKQEKISGKKNECMLILNLDEDGNIQIDKKGRVKLRPIGIKDFWALAIDLLSDQFDVSEPVPLPEASVTSDLRTIINTYKEWAEATAPSGVMKDIFQFYAKEPLTLVKTINYKELYDQLPDVNVSSIWMNTDDIDVNLSGSPYIQINHEINNIRNEFKLSEFDATLFWIIQHNVDIKLMKECAIAVLKAGVLAADPKKHRNFITRAHVFVKLHKRLSLAAGISEYHKLLEDYKGAEADRETIKQFRIDLHNMKLSDVQ